MVVLLQNVDSAPSTRALLLMVADGDRPLTVHSQGWSGRENCPIILFRPTIVPRAVRTGPNGPQELGALTGG